MLSKLLRTTLFFVLAISLLSCSNIPADTQTQRSTNKTDLQFNAPAFLTGPIYNQPIDPAGKLFLSSWLDPDGSDFDQYVWDNFTLQSNQTITEVDWLGGYDPTRLGAGGPALDFSVSIYPSIAAGTEPAVANPPLVHYQTGGNAGETSIGQVGGITMYTYAFSLPTPFIASAGVKYWVQIEASQGGSNPDWGIAAGTAGNGSHYLRASGAGGDILFRSVPGDAAFALLGQLPDTATPTDTATATMTETATETPTDTATSTLTETPTNTQTSTATATDTPTSTPTATASPIPSPVDSFTPTGASTSTPVNDNTPGKVTGGGNLDLQSGKLTFGLVVQYEAGDAVPSGNLTFKDHGSNLSLKATYFTLLVIRGNHALVMGYATINDQLNVPFTFEVEDFGEPGSSDTFTMQIANFNGYSAGGTLSGGNIQVAVP